MYTRDVPGLSPSALSACVLLVLLPAALRNILLQSEPAALFSAIDTRRVAMSLVAASTSCALISRMADRDAVVGCSILCCFLIAAGGERLGIRTRACAADQSAGPDWGAPCTMLASPANGPAADYEVTVRLSFSRTRGRGRYRRTSRCVRSRGCGCRSKTEDIGQRYRRHQGVHAPAIHARTWRGNSRACVCHPVQLLAADRPPALHLIWQRPM